MQPTRPFRPVASPNRRRGGEAPPSDVLRPTRLTHPSRRSTAAEKHAVAVVGDVEEKEQEQEHQEQQEQEQEEQEEEEKEEQEQEQEQEQDQ